MSPRTSVEAMWNPKSAREDTAPETDTTGGVEDPPRPKEKEEGDAHHHQNGDHSKSSLHRAKHLLAALSFESRPLRLRRHRKKNKPRTSSSLRRRPAPIDTLSSPHHHHGNVIRASRVGSTDSDVYFDASQYGDLNTNEFKLRPEARESIVLSGIKVTSHATDNEVEAVFSEHYNDHHLAGGDYSNSSTAVDEDNEECYGEDYDYDRHEGSEATGYSSQAEDEAASNQHHSHVHPKRPFPSPRPPDELPLRFLRAGKNDPVEGLRRYEATLRMRKENGLDNILREPSPHFDIIKKNYPHFCHLKGKNGEPCFYEQPPKTNLKALRAAGVTVEKLMHHYTQITEYQWQYLERDDLATSIYIIDLEGIRMTDFVGESVDFVKKASAFSAQHYPERAGFVFVVNVPSWFKIIWNVLKPIIDEDTVHKIKILRGKDEIRKAMQERIPLENIPPEYGGQSMPLGESPEEKTLAEWIAHNNTLADENRTCCPADDCKFCNWVPARSY